MRQPVADRNQRLETAISWVLIVGVVLSSLLELAGFALYFVRHGNLEISQDPSVFIRGSNFFSFLFDEITPQHTGDIAIILMSLGLAVLMLTPFVRVLFSVIFFGRVRDFKYVWITLFVLVVLTVSLALH
jgi:uncharacterized membrane protein